MWFRRPPPRRSRVTHMDREESVPLDGAWNMHVESLWLSWGARRCSRHGARAHVSARRLAFPSDGEEGSLTFMILSRSSKKRWGLSGFVKVGEVLVAADKGNADDWESVNGVLARSKISGSLLHRTSLR